MNNKAYIALGTNIEPRLDFLKQALSSLRHDRCIHIKQLSTIYETPPVGYEDQAHFLNMVIEIDTSYEMHKLLDTCQYIENELGRERTVRFGPRTIDLDILMYNNDRSDTERLLIPHPRLHERAFVLVPLNEIASDVNVAGLDKPVNILLGDLPEADKVDIVVYDTIRLDELPRLTDSTV